jgi:6-O-methylguanine DNA methyltransferase, DNA binding domain/6-O-methylguanine DNA methyltransferase, ribonuclease-like domain
MGVAVGHRGSIPGAAISRFDRPGRLPIEMTIAPGWTIYESPIGPLTLAAGQRGITSIHWPGRSPRLPEGERRPLPELVRQLDAYFAGARQVFELDLDLRGDPLQSAVWRQLLEIPFGTTATYGEVAGGSTKLSTTRALSPTGGRGSSARRSAATRSRSSSPAIG